MKILHLWKSDSGQFGGGGAIAMSRLHSGLRAAGIDSQILCDHTTTNSPYVQTLHQWLPLTILEKFLKQVTSRLGLNDIHRLSFFDIKQHKAYIDADILHFHGTHGNFMNYLALPSLTQSKPSVFSLHDMWVLTGHCAFSYACDRWQTGCGKCPHLDAYPPVKRDATHLEWKLKNWVYNHANLAFISKSKWLTEIAKQSMLSHYPIHEIPHGIDTTIYHPLDQTKCQIDLGIPVGKKVLMFAAVELSDFRKGGDLLLKALQRLPASLKSETVLLTIGKSAEVIAKATEMQTFNLGYVSDDARKAICYCAADLFLFPTRAETFGNVALESIACGTPVVAFQVGGVPDIVRSGITGYLAKPENVKDFSQGIVRLLEDESLRRSMGQQCYKIALEEYNLQLSVQRYINLYQTLIH